MKTCVKCSEPANDAARFCSKCGQRFAVETYPPSTSSPAPHAKPPSPETAPEWRTNLDRMLAQTRIERRPDKPVISEHDSPRREEVFLAPAHCSRTRKPFGIRFERADRGVWEARGTTELSERALRSSVFTQKDEIDWDTAPSYRCPHCSDHGLVVCSCGVLSCGGTLQDTSNHVCPACGNTGPVTAADHVTLRGARDR